jgi:hypothetical protein
MEHLRDGDVIQIRSGDNPLHGEWLDTNDRIGIRITDKYGRGILLERDCMARLHELFSQAVPK